MQTYGKILLIAIPIFFIMILTEYIYGRFKGNDTMPIPDGISSLYSGLTNSLKDVLGLSIAIISYEMMVDKLAIFSLPNHVWTYVIAFVAIDFKGYWVHRLEHKINILWNRHIIHHSSEEFNLACALRQTISTFFELFFWLLLPAAIIGVPAQVIAILLPIHLFLQFWYHTRHIGKMGFLERIIVTPAHHRVHHAINEQYLDKNFGQIFIFWDKWFGTFQEELPDVPPVYGIKRPARTYNPIVINFQHLGLMIIDAWQTKHLWDKLRIWFMPTGWRPEDVAQLNPVNTIEDVYQYEKFTPYISSKALKLHFLNLFSLLIVIYFFFGHIADFSSYGLMSFGVFFFLQIYSASELLNGRSIGLWLGVLTSILGLYLCLFLFPKNLNQWALITYSIFLSWMLLQLIVIAYTFYSGGFDHRIAPKN